MNIFEANYESRWFIRKNSFSDIILFQLKVQKTTLYVSQCVIRPRTPKYYNNNPKHKKITKKLQTSKLNLNI